MTLPLKDTLRSMRQRAGMTQSALAERLGVSDRAVSRWDNGESYPNITLLPQLAMLLHVSVDALLGMDSQRRQSAIEEALRETQTCMEQGRTEQAEAKLREALTAYPDEPELMVALARTLMHKYTEPAAREALALCRSAEGRPARLSTQYGCKQVAAMALHRLGKSEQAAQLVSDEMPSFWASRELLYPRVAPPDKAQQQRRFNLLWLADHVATTLRDMAKASEPPEAIDLLERAIRVYREVTGPHAGMYEERICRAYLTIAELHRETGDTAAAQVARKHAEAAACAYAAHGGSYEAPWLAGLQDAPAPEQAVSVLLARIADHDRRFTDMTAQ